MAFVDLTTGKIYGTEKGTKTYYHEEAHIKYPETKRGERVRMLQDVSLDFLIFCLGVNVIYPHLIIKFLVVILLITKSISMIVEEWDCWKYAEGKLKGEIKEDGLERTEIQKV